MAQEYDAVSSPTARTVVKQQNNVDCSPPPPLSSASFLSLFLFGVMGTGIVLPFYVMMNCADWYRRAHPDVDLLTRMTFDCTLALLLATIVLTFFPTERYVSRAALGFASALAIAARLAVAAGEHAAPSVLAFETAAAALGVADAVASSGVYVLAAATHPRCTVVLAMGTAVAGPVASVLRLSPLGEGLGSFWCASCVASLGSTLALLAATRDDAYEGEDARSRDDDDDESSPMLSSSRDRRVSREDAAPKRAIDESSLSVATLCLETFSVAWKPVVAMFLNFFVSFSLFPGPVSSFPSDGLFGDERFPVVLVATFTSFDVLGRVVLSGNWAWNGRLLDRLLRRTKPVGMSAPRLANVDSMVLRPSWIRFAFFPLVVACRAPMMTTATAPIANLLSRDVVRLTVVAALGATNGFASAACFVVGPVMTTTMMTRRDTVAKNGDVAVRSERHRDAASQLLLLSCFSGMTVGSFFALVVDRAMDHYFASATSSC